MLVYLERGHWFSKLCRKNKRKQSSSMNQILLREDFEMSSGLTGVNFTWKDLKWVSQGQAASKLHVVTQTQIQWPNPPLNFISRTCFWSWWNQMRKRKQTQPGWGEKSWEKPQCGYVLCGEPWPHLFASVWVQVYSLSSHWESCFLNHCPSVCNKGASWVWCLGS